MAFYTDTFTSNTSITARIAEVISAFKIATQQRRQYRKTMSELNAMTSRELADIGINRSMISKISYDAAYKS